MNLIDQQRFVFLPVLLHIEKLNVHEAKRRLRPRGVEQ